MVQKYIIIYTTEDGLAKIEMTFDEDTEWLSIDQMAELFQRDKSTISRHIKNIFSEGELARGSVAANFATTISNVEEDYLNSIKMLEQKPDSIINIKAEFGKDEKC